MTKTRVLPGAMPFWMFNDASTLAEKLDFLHRCHAGGIRALTMHSRSGNLLPYGSDEWYETVRNLVIEARNLDMEMWLYDEDPFPSGAAGGMVMAERPDLLARCLTCIPLPDDRQPGQLWTIGPKRIVWAGLVPTRPGLEAIPYTGAVGSVRVDWFMSEWDSRYYYLDVAPFPCPRGNTLNLRYAMHVPPIPDGYRLIAIEETVAAEDTAWNGLPDLLQFDTFDVFRRLSLDKYTAYVGEFFGNTIPGIFTDEPKYHGGFPVTPSLFEDFRQHFGYDLQSRLYQLFGEPLTPEWEKTRVDYRHWLGQRFLAAFLRPYRQWCDSHRLLLVGHLSPEDDQVLEAACLTSHMPILKTMSWPGTDIIVPMVGDADAPSLNLGSLRCGSVRSQRGGTYTASETLALTDWDVSTRLCRHLLAWQKVLGIDRFFYHGFYSSSEGVSLYEAPPDYGPNSPIFRGIGVLNGWLERIETIMDGNDEEAPVAVLNSQASFLTIGNFLGEERHQHLREAMARVLLGLLRAHVGVHLVDDEDLVNADLGPGSIAIGRRSYSAVVVPPLDLIPESALSGLREAANAGVRVCWFGGGPGRYIDADNEFQQISSLPGDTLAADWPDDAWCRDAFAPAIAIQGEHAADTYARRFTAEDGRVYALLTYLRRDRDTVLDLPREPDGRCWVPVEIDGDVDYSGGAAAWRVPAYGCGLFRLEQCPESPQPTAWQRLRATGGGRRFERLGANVLRLQAVTVRRPDREDRQLPFPQPYWNLYQDYRASHRQESFAGPIPVVSEPMQPDVSYSFALRATDELAGLELVLDPRFARGTFDAYLDDTLLRAGLRFPLEHITPDRLALPPLAAGDHAITLRFRMGSAMDGILSQLYLEGAFLLDVDGDRPALCSDAPADALSGWPDAGLPHYMGDGLYTWDETLTADEAAAVRAIQFDDILDAAELKVNGAPAGSRAWQPYLWTGLKLREGVNHFELRVSSTAGNRFKLDYPRQAQGWLGEAWLLA